MVLESKIESFLGKIELGIGFFKDAGALLVKMLDEDPKVADEIILSAKSRHIDWITMDVIGCFEMIGRNQLAPEAMFLPRHVLNRLIELPVEEQSAIATKTFPVVTGLINGSAAWQTKTAGGLNRREAARVISNKGLRTVEEQSAMLAGSKKYETVGLFRVIVKNGGVEILKITDGKKSFACQSVRLTNGEAEIELVTLQ